MNNDLESSISDPKVFSSAIAHLRASDPRLCSLIRKHGKLEFSTSDDIFEALVYSIISQQLSSKAADAIAKRVATLFPESKLTAAGFAKIRAQRLRSAGLSPQKITYIRDLCKRVLKNSLDFKTLKQTGDDEVVAILDVIRGVGPWTAKMILIFSLGRPDILAVEDLGLRNMIKKIYSLRTVPSPETMQKIAKPWHPFCSVASLYLWKERDGAQ